MFKGSIVQPLLYQKNKENKNKSDIQPFYKYDRIINRGKVRNWKGLTDALTSDII